MFSLEQKTFCIHIPQEIYDLIIHQAKTDRSTLYNLCLVSSSFLPQAQRTLYHDLNISTDGYSLCSGWRINATQAMSLFRTLTELNPALAKYVQSLYHRLSSYHGFVERLVIQTVLVSDIYRDSKYIWLVIFPIYTAN